MKKTILILLLLVPGIAVAQVETATSIAGVPVDIDSVASCITGDVLTCSAQGTITAAVGAGGMPIGLSGLVVETAADLQTAVGGQTCGSGNVAYATSCPMINHKIVGKADWFNIALTDDDCAGDQAAMWWDSTQNRFEICNDNAGAPLILGKPGPLEWCFSRRDLDSLLSNQVFSYPGSNITLLDGYCQCAQGTCALLADVQFETVAADGAATTVSVLPALDCESITTTDTRTVFTSGQVVSDRAVLRFDVTSVGAASDQYAICFRYTVN